MAKITYTLTDFDSDKAAEGALCVAVKYNYTDSSISNLVADSTADITTWSKNTNFLGAGICQYNKGTFYLVVDSIRYSFNSKGDSSDYITRQYKLMLASVDASVMSTGTSATSSTTSVTRRSSSEVTTETTEEESTVLVDYLTARDHFANQALKSLIASIPNAATLSSNEISFYCNMAYEWAAGMMNAAANARSTFEDEEGTSIDTSTLETNTEKILFEISQKVGKESTSGVKVTEMPELTLSSVPNLKVTSLPTLEVNDINVVNSGSTSIGSNGLGRDAEHPLYIAGNGLTQSEVDARIKAWLNATTIVADGDGWVLNVPESI